jgi:hypothetical protein
MNTTKLFTKTALILAIAATPMFAMAESNISTGAGALTATARLDFQITIPKVLFLQVGTGTNMAANAAINKIDFTVPAANVGDGVAIAASLASGDLGNGVVTAKVVGNNGNITFTSTTLGALSNATADTISYSEIGTTVALNTSAVALAHPALADAATTSITLTPAAGKVISRDAKWTFKYLNSNVVAPGTYGGVNANNSRVTYTASMP